MLRFPLPGGASAQRSLYLASSSEPGIAIEVQWLQQVLHDAAPPGMAWTISPMPEETTARFIIRTY